jgi:hypothetical protein
MTIRDWRHPEVNKPVTGGRLESMNPALARPEDLPTRLLVAPLSSPLPGARELDNLRGEESGAIEFGSPRTAATRRRLEPRQVKATPATKTRPDGSPSHQTTGCSPKLAGEADL